MSDDGNGVPKIRFELVPNGEGYMVKGYVGEDLVDELPAKDEKTAQALAELWKANTEKELKSAVGSMEITRSYKEEKVL